MASGLRMLVALWMTGNVAMAADLNAEDVVGESKTTTTLDTAGRSISNTLVKYSWGLVEAYDADGAVQSGWSNEGAKEFGFERLQLWFSADALSTRVCNSLTWNYSLGPQGQMSLSPSWQTMSACVGDGDGDQTMQLEARVTEKISQVRRYELTQFAARLPTLHLYFSDGSRWELQTVELAGVALGR